MRLTEVYTTYGKNFKRISTADFETQDFDSITSAYAACIDHEVECLKEGDAEIISIDGNEIEYMMDGEKFISEVTLYDEDGDEMPMSGYWYAVQEDSSDAWDVGSYDLDEAEAMLEAQGHGLIAVIDEFNGVCVKEIPYEG